MLKLNPLPPKAAAASKMNWVNFIVAILGVVQSSEGIIPGKYSGYVITAIGIINFVLSQFFRKDKPIERQPSSDGTKVDWNIRDNV